jgi:hypothetical protein
MSPAPRIARRLFLASAAASLCSACEHSEHSYLTDIPGMFASLGKSGDLPLTRADVDRIGYASIAVRMGEGAQALLILGRFEGDELNWISAEREVIVTRMGRVVKTFGLPEDVRTTIFLTADPLGRPAADLAAMPDCVRTLDFEPRHRDGVLARSRFYKVGDEDLTILGERHATELWEERGTAPGLQWEFVNRYWIETATGFVWKSRQAAAPGIPPLEIVTYRRAA